MKNLHKIVVLVAGVLSIIAAMGRCDEEPREKRWKLQAGWVHQWGQGMKVSGPAPSLYRSLIPHGRSEWTGRLPPDAMTGPEEGVPNNWNFDDGYVFPDEQSGVRPGGDPSAPYSTHYWHYTNPGQYNAAENTLTFHRDTELHAEGAASRRGDNDDTFRSDGIEIKASRWLHSWEEWGLDLDLVLGIAWFPDTQTMRNSRATEQSMSRGMETYIYSDYFGSPEGGSWQPKLDHWYPYVGRFHTNDDAPGDNPIIPLEYDVGSDRTSGRIRDSVLIKGKLWRLRGEIGPMLSYAVTQRLSVYATPQFVLEFVDMSVDRKESVTYTDGGKTSRLGSRSNHKNETDVVPGVLLTAGANYLVSENWYLGGSLGYEWLFRDVDVKVGPDKVEFDLEGGEFGLYVGRKF